MQHEVRPRRSFLNYLLGTSAGATLVAVFYPMIKFVIPPHIAESLQNSVIACKVSELLPNAGKIVKFGNKPVILIRTQAGDLKAFSATCTHLDCIVQYRPEEKGIWCACHNGRYNLNGQNISGPPPRPLEAYAVNVRGEDIVITKA